MNLSGYAGKGHKLAWLWLQNQPTSALSLWFHERVRVVRSCKPSE